MALLVSLLATAALVAGCRDVTSPSGIPVESVQASYSPDYSLETPDTTMTVPGYQGYGTLPSASAPGINVSHYTVAELTLYSSVTGSTSAGYTTSFGVRGEGCPYNNLGRLAFGSNGGGTLNLCVFAPAGQDQKATTVVDTIGVQGSVAFSRFSHSTTLNWSASAATATIRPIPVELEVQGLNHLGSTVLHLDESTILLTGTAVQLELRNDPEIVRVRTGLWLQTGSVRFQPDSGPAITCSPTLNFNGTRRARCPLTGITRSGTLTVTALANGKWQTKELKIIRKQNLKLTASPPDTLVGSTVRFTATMDGHPVPVSEWTWNPPESSTFLNSMAGESSVTSGPCPSGTPDCDRLLDQIGTGMMAVRIATGDTASAPATARDTTCMTGDSILDDPVVRDSLAVLWVRSIADGSMYNKREYSLSVFDSSGRYVIRMDPLPIGATACTTYHHYYNPPPGRLVAWFHIHPFALGDPVPYYCVDGAQPGDSVVYEWGKGGLSNEDWVSTIRPPAPRHRVYAIDAKNIFRADSTLHEVDFFTVGSKLVPKDAKWKSAWERWDRHKTSDGRSCSIIAAFWGFLIPLRRKRSSVLSFRPARYLGFTLLAIVALLVPSLGSAQQMCNGPNEFVEHQRAEVAKLVSGSDSASAYRRERSRLIPTPAHAVALVSDSLTCHRAATAWAAALKIAQARPVWAIRVGTERFLVLDGEATVRGSFLAIVFDSAFAPIRRLSVD